MFAVKVAAALGLSGLLQAVAVCNFFKCFCKSLLGLPAGTSAFCQQPTVLQLLLLSTVAITRTLLSKSCTRVTPASELLKPSALAFWAITFDWSPWARMIILIPVTIRMSPINTARGKANPFSLLAIR